MKKLLFLFIIVAHASIMCMDTKKEIFKAIRENDIKKIRQLIVNSKIPLNITNEQGDFPLVFALKQNNVEMVRELLKIPRNWWKDKNTYNDVAMALILAIDLQNKIMIDTILNDKNIILSFVIDSTDKQGDTPLIHAIKTKNIEIITSILNEVPDQSIKNKSGQTAMDIVQMLPQNTDAQKILKNQIIKLLNLAQSRFELLKELIKEDPNINKINSIITSPDILNIPSNWQNPLRIIINDSKLNPDKQLGLIKLFISKGANANLILRSGATPFSEITIFKPKIIEFLLQKGANPNIPSTFRGETLIFKAINDDNLEIIDLLIKYGANIDYKIIDPHMNPDTGSTPLIFALDYHRSKYELVIQRLLDAGADPLIKNLKGKTALDIVEANKAYYSNNIIKRLKEKAQTKLLLADLQKFIQRLKTLHKYL